jgi:hypothetical protein
MAEVGGCTGGGGGMHVHPVHTPPGTPMATHKQRSGQHTLARHKNEGKECSLRGEVLGATGRPGNLTVQTRKTGHVIGT